MKTCFGIIVTCLLLALGTARGLTPLRSPDGSCIVRAGTGFEQPPADFDTQYDTIGGGDVTQSNPWWTDKTSIRLQMLYLRSEINRAGRISIFGFQNGNAATGTFPDVTIKMCHTAVSVLTATFADNYGGNTPVTVLPTTPSFVAGSAGNGNYEAYALATPFDYNNSNNLLVEITWNGTPYGSTVFSNYLIMSAGDYRYAWATDYQAQTASVVRAWRYNARFGFTSAGLEQESESGMGFVLEKGWPTPFANQTAIRYAVPWACPVEVVVYSATGQLLRMLHAGGLMPGYYQVVWNGRDEQGRLLGPGVYYCQLKAQEFTAVNKLVKVE